MVSRNVGTSRHDCRVGEIESWVTTISAVIAVMISLFLLRQGQIDRRRVREHEERDQAQRVSSWCAWRSDDSSTFERPRLPTIFVCNASGAAVYDVFVDYSAPDSGQRFRRALGAVAPGETRYLEVEYDAEVDRSWEPAAMHPRTYFRDSAGTYWLRDSLGRLRRDPGAAADEFFDNGGVLLR